ncbi:MAG: hypothetical protein JW870_21510 [Candidatus Delongbacteria bacterium]|nr:hypothetical protein [Candidatus Delongbacteria bacterium]
MIDSEDFYNKVDEITNRFEIKTYKFRPYYSGSNIDFFEKNIFSNEEDILNQSYDMKTIYGNMKLNRNFYGKLFIDNFGKISISPNSESFGTISDLDLFIRKLSTSNTMWFKTRNGIEPCKSCLYADLCQPISDYELYMKKNDLCNIASKQSGMN